VPCLPRLLDESNNWTKTWEKLQKYEGGKAIDYTVTEDPVANYSTRIIKATDGTFTYTVKNSRTTEKTEVSVEKIWDDNDNKEGFRPASVTVKLLANGEEAGTATLDKDNSWKYEWTDLQKFEDGEEIVYTVTEAQIANYKAPVIKKVSETAWAYTVTNSRDYEETEASVKKVWDDADNQDGYRPETLTVKLLADGKDTGKTVTLSEDNDWEDKIEKTARSTQAARRSSTPGPEGGLPTGLYGWSATTPRERSQPLPTNTPPKKPTWTC
jgi:Cna protein B-type domain.